MRVTVYIAIHCDSVEQREVNQLNTNTYISFSLLAYSLGIIFFFIPKCIFT